MKKLLWCEYRKTRRRRMAATVLLLLAAQLVWSLHGLYDEFAIKNGWMMFLYRMPLTSAIFLPLLAAVVSSRLADLEHRGGMLKTLAVVCGRGRLYDAKLLYGLGIMGVCIVTELAAVIGFGIYTGFAGAVPVKLYLLLLLFTLVPTLTIYCLQHMLAMLYQNQAAAFFAGIAGAFAGLFSMFLPYRWLKIVLPWGHYGALGFVGLFGWTKKERYAHAYFEVMDLSWGVCLLALAAAAVLYALGRHLFVKKEL